jgi:epoxyqueuosine reductase QueG
MKKVLISTVQNFVDDYQQQKHICGSWGTPLVGFAAANDPLFSRLQFVASPTHAVPQDFLPDAETIIAYFIPFDKSISRSNIKGRHCSEAWAVAYIETNELIRNLSLHLEEHLLSKGYKSVVIPATHNWDESKLISDWSHRHVAYMAGLGTFGLNNMLITDKGCCGRVGSFITSAAVSPDTRKDQENCLFKFDGSCGKCAERCINEALFTESFDRFKCYEMCLENEEKQRAVGYADVCGKCLVGVPCSHSNPVALKLRK